MSSVRLRVGDKVLVGAVLVEVDQEFADSLGPEDLVVGVAATGALRRIPASVVSLVDRAVGESVEAFRRMQSVTASQVTDFYDRAASRLSDDTIFELIRSANTADIESAQQRGRSTTRLILSDAMRNDMVSAFLMWRESDVVAEQQMSTTEHRGWNVEQWRSPLGPIGFVFEGRPNVFSDATGVLRSGNVVIFRIGSDALGTARSIMQNVVTPSLVAAGLPPGAVTLLDSPEHAAGWRLFSDARIALAVARGSGEAVAELGSIAQQSGVPVSLHGTGGAWMIAGCSADVHRFASVVEHSLDRKVCNTLNVLCVVEDRAAELLPVAYQAAERAAHQRGQHARIHADVASAQHLPSVGEISVSRAGETVTEQQVTVSDQVPLSHEFEWEENPEFHVVTVPDVATAVELFNRYSPRFIVSIVSEDEAERNAVWLGCDAPFVGDGFTRWVDGQFALLAPELGLSNWQNGRLFGRGGILSGDSAFTVRLRVRQSDTSLHR